MKTSQTPNLSKEEESLLNYFIDEYNDLFSFIMILSSNEFFAKLERKVQITLAPKNKAFPSGSFNKLSNVIKTSYYEPEYKIVKQLIQSIDNIKKCTRFTQNTYIPHCNDTKEPIHKCGERLFYFPLSNQQSYLMCLKCKQIYKSNCVLFHCNHCDVDYYSSINETDQSDIKYQPATWAKYHCHAVINDMMKCFKCKDILHINMANNKLVCLSCGFEAEQNKIKWKCLICHSDFMSEAKVYNPLEFKAMKMAVKNTLFDAKEAKPPFVPCCDIDVNSVRFIHKKECDGIIYLGTMNKRAIVVCSKCHLLNFYENHYWMCPKCKERFKTGKVSSTTPNSKNFKKTSSIEKEKECLDIPPNKDSKSKYSTPKENEEESEIKRNKFDPKRKNSQLIRYDHVKQVKGASSKCLKFNAESNSGSENNVIEITNRNVSRFNVQLDNIDNTSPGSTNNTNTNNQNSHNSNNSTSNSNKQHHIPIKSSKSNIDMIKSKPQPNININLNVNVNIQNNDDSSSSAHSEDGEFKSDDYVVIKQIGEGTFGKIYLVENKKKEQFAMKKILANSIEEINALKTEYELLLALPSYERLNVVRIHGIESKKLDKTTFVMYVLMDVAVRDWEKEIERRNCKKSYYSEHELIKIIQELVATFSELQRNNISHRDIKPQNILLFKDATFRIADFGEAKEVIQKRNTLRQTIRGTELYMSPVLFTALQAKGSYQKYTEHNTFKSDVFSFGLCVLLAASLTFNCLYDVRELDDMISLKIVLNRYLKVKYSNNFIEILCTMLELTEKDRCDFIGLEKMVCNLK